LAPGLKGLIVRPGHHSLKRRWPLGRAPLAIVARVAV
jgi:hypothetical protein